MNLLFLTVKSQDNHIKNYWHFSKLFLWLKNKNNFGDFVKGFG